MSGNAYYTASYPQSNPSVYGVLMGSLANVQRYKQDAVFFQKLRASVKLRYAEEIRDWKGLGIELSVPQLAELDTSELLAAD